MDPSWFSRNVARSWRTRGSIPDFLNRLAWTYSNVLPSFLSRSEYVIGFVYPSPIGAIRLLVRNNAGGDNFIHSEVFEHEYYRLPLNRAPRTILDVGANAGFSGVYFGRMYPGAQIACVEPIPANARILEINLKLNRVPAIVLQVAAHTSDNPVRMQIEARDFGHKVASAIENEGEQLVVQGLTVTSIMGQLGWSRVDLLKMDVEGHERALLAEPSWLENVGTLCLECHEGFGGVELSAIAERFGFNAPSYRHGLWLLTRAI